MSLCDYDLDIMSTLHDRDARIKELEVELARVTAELQETLTAFHRFRSGTSKLREAARDVVLACEAVAPLVVSQLRDALDETERDDS